ncbi:hypothetical protein H3Z83_12590 [Tenacibaculum sp. S7007]|uniref:Outer membrane protein beta-barrel domain-containing protein n=1 Tax=Tenacibaculum pelagium TaxID=2759527 RepID=A0A839ARQ1_9FLAO|nr:hypothetical protein [Tenacibaculum pelagium]MBA6157347.1 hypothetical protein [Tenacibaculum pelagium]
MQKQIPFLIILMLTTCLLAQQKNTNKILKNQLRIGLDLGVGVGFNSIDLFVDENNKPSSISAGGGLKIGINLRYIFNNKYEIGTGFSYNSSTLRPELSNVSTSFNRISIQPTFKYLIGLDSKGNETLNLGIGYGFYTGGRLKVDAEELGFKEILNYRKASGIVFLTEYELVGTKKLGALIGIKYYNATYDNKQPVNDTDFDKLKGDGIDLYFGLTYKI